MAAMRLKIPMARSRSTSAWHAAFDGSVEMRDSYAVWMKYST